MSSLAHPFGTVSSVPLGCRVILFLCLIGFIVDTLFLPLQCSPKSILENLQVWTLVTAIFVHTSWFSLFGGLVLGWRRFVRLENEHGTLGFFLWIGMVSGLIHLVYIALATFFGVGGPVHGIWPLVCLLYTQDARSDPLGNVLLWPLPLSVYTRTVPLLALLCAWLVHFTMHMDALIAMAIGLLVPVEKFNIPEHVHEWLDKLDNRLIQVVKNQDSFATRQAGFKSLPTYAINVPSHDGNGSTVKASDGNLHFDVDDEDAAFNDQAGIHNIQTMSTASSFSSGSASGNGGQPMGGQQQQLGTQQLGNAGLPVSPSSQQRNFITTDPFAPSVHLYPNPAAAFDEADSSLSSVSKQYETKVKVKDDIFGDLGNLENPFDL